jgi:deoxyribose-phosphate aldolase
MRKSVSERVRVKAAGGIRTLDAALPAIRVGTVRFGTTASNVILDEAARREKDGTLDAAVDAKITEDSAIPERSE